MYERGRGWMSELNSWDQEDLVSTRAKAIDQVGVDNLAPVQHFVVCV